MKFPRRRVWMPALLVALLLPLARYPRRVLKGPLASVRVSRESLNPAPSKPDLTNNYINEDVKATAPADLKEIQESLRWVWQPVLPLDSYEGWPRYHMKVTYATGEIEELHFMRTEFAGGASTPRRFMAEIDALFARER